MLKKFTFAFVASFAACISLPVFAADNTAPAPSPAAETAPAPEGPKASAATINELLDIINIDKMMDSVWNVAANSAGQYLAHLPGSKDWTPAQVQAARAGIAKVMDTFKSEFSGAELRKIYVKVYSEIFTEEEVRAIITFYKTPAGTALIQKTPQVMQKSAELVQQRMTEMAPRMQAALEEVAKDAAKAGAAGGAPATPPTPPAPAGK